MKPLFLLLLFTSTACFSQTFEDYLSETSPVYPGCENEKLRHLCYQQKISGQVRDRVNTHLNDAALTANEIAITLRLRSEKDGKRTVLQLSADNPVAEKAAAEAIAALPLLKPAVNEKGDPVVSTAGFVIKLHRDAAGKPFEVVPPPPSNAASMPHPAMMSRKHIIFPGCESVPEAARASCFSEKFTDWLLGRLGKNTKYEPGLLRLELTFGRDGKLESHKIINSPSERLSEAVEKALQKCPNVTPGETNGEKSTMTYTVPILFK